ncbi:type II toxin-antitoxin system RelE/ParE family toxin [Campylobacter helveticus]|uniref:type II toxin-antitoxin system RelE/ParE family toxin n=1 Tax=Campylobacter helveticus TaxID=28898 RepID=UPI0009C37290|nr:type II toxin-antitoxin system RelE/ParE family toxin [Campylobacter helveticus]ARE80262.1 toxin-antitoxin system, toxin component, RelE/ParE family [Campylobacter helveticus]MCR2040451.1 type II toxin-antitoxin system RelE/ParE family toxin [Campylobacter helveticus]MCR2055690.1 type II toxin-antitoxin system RelE/ParE family toxin [Campylobacter helveticus]MCR2057484.1 type II toxin-antitoxin system RelE/ParE family toxin [Campylobacter helveticus]MCR2060536.1 type II toxin-antitoxin syst
MQLYGNEVKEPHSKFLGRGLFELRVKGKDNVARLFYAFQKDKKIYILHGFIKKSQKTPKNELEIAYKKLKELNDE